MEGPVIKTTERHSPDEAVNDWRTALRYLESGNKRYAENRPLDRSLDAEERELLSKEQKPFAAVLTCSDSRVAPEVFFDQRPGDIFVVRNAGGIADAASLGSIEFAACHLKTPLIVVVGHSDCGAVTGAFEGGEYEGNLRAVIGGIRSAVEDCETLEAAVHANTRSVVRRICENETVRRLNAVTLGAYYDIATGIVTFTED